MKAHVGAVLALLTVAPAGPRPDVSLPLIEYRVLSSIGQVRLTQGFVHDPDTQTYMLGRLASFDEKGVILVAGNTPREFKRRETIGSHSVETVIRVYPTTGEGYGGGLATANIVVTVDGRKRIDCPWIQQPIELADVSIAPVDGMISIAAQVGEKRINTPVFLNGDVMIDQAWLERRAR